MIRYLLFVISQATAELVYGILTTKVKNAFYKLNVHAGTWFMYMYMYTCVYEDV